MVKITELVRMDGTPAYGIEVDGMVAESPWGEVTSFDTELEAQAEGEKLQQMQDAATADLYASGRHLD